MYSAKYKLLNEHKMNQARCIKIIDNPEIWPNQELKEPETVEYEEHDGDVSMK